MIKDFKNKTIIYMWFNKMTGNVYVGSGLKGCRRLRSYFAPSVLNSNPNSLIYKNLLKYGHANFNLIILEQFNFSSDLSIKERKELYLKKETFYIDWASNTYNACKLLNILPIAGSSLGYKHRIETRELMSKSHSKSTLVTNIITKELKEFSSIKETGGYYKVSNAKIKSHIKKKVLCLIYI